MESVYLKTLREAVNCGSFAKAADVLYVTQSAVSRRVKFLEDQLGAPLLDRSGPVLVATEAGKLVLQKAEKILGIEQEILAGLNSLKNRRQVSFCCTPPFAITHLPKIMQQYMLTKSETIDLKFMMDIPERILAGLKKGIYDFAVMEYCICFDLDDFHAFDLSGDRMVFFRRKNPHDNGRPPQLEELFEQTLFTRIEGCCSRTFLENNLEKFNRDISAFKNVVVFEDINLILQSVKNGDGIGYISSDIIKTCTNPEEITTFGIDGFQTDRKRALIFNDDPDKDPLFQDFKDLVIQTMT